MRLGKTIRPGYCWDAPGDHTGAASPLAPNPRIARCGAITPAKRRCRQRWWPTPETGAAAILVRLRAAGGANFGRGALDAGDVARIFKRLADQAGIEADDISGHSTPVGAAQDLAAAGFGLPEILVAGGWRSPTMVGRYTERQAAAGGAMARLAQRQNRA